MGTRASEPLFTFAASALRLGDRLVFRNVHWIFARDQHWALVGPNGSGKTLLASALAGEVPVIGGEIDYRLGRRAGRVPEDAVAHVSFEQQKAVAGDAPAASRWFCLEEDEAIPVSRFLSQDNVEEINPFEVVARSRPSVAAFSARRRRVARLLQIEPLFGRPLPSLSSGEMRKVLLARALLRRPRLLILDDPFTGLDAGFRIHLKHILNDLIQQSGVRLLLIVNRRDELPRGLTHLMCVQRCRIVAQGRLQAMLKHPCVRELFGEEGARNHRREIPKALAGRNRRGNEEIARLKRVTVRYGRRVILRDVDWTVRRGESWALLGPNGSGKSTLLSLIIGDNPQAYANALFLFGRRRGSGESVWDLKKRIGWISAELHLHFPEAQTSLDTVLSGFHDSAGCYRRFTPCQRRIARRWLACFGLAGCADRPLGSLSAGLQRMVLLARALVKSPDLLVLDEPCQGLDHAHRRLFLGIVETLLDRIGTTIIYVTHRQDEIPRGIRRVLCLKDGRAVQS